MQKKFVGDKCGRGREGQHGYKQQQTRSSVGGKAKNTTRTHSFHQHNTGACMRGRGQKKNKQINTSHYQSISNRACGGGPKKSPKKTPNRLHDQQWSMREEKQTQQTDQLRQLWSNRETGKQQKPINPRAPTKHHNGRNYRRERKSEILFGKARKKAKQNKTEGKHLIRPNG